MLIKYHGKKIYAITRAREKTKMGKLKPKTLVQGDKIAIISPSGSVSYQEKFKKACRYFKNKGFEVEVFPSAKNINGYLAGSDDERLQDLTQAFTDKSVKAILTSRGGYGALRILDKIDYEIIKNNPKIFCGYSDITAYHAAIFKKTGLVTFHAPFALFDFGADEIDPYTERNFFKMLSANFIGQPLENTFEYACVNESIVQGELIGGNLCTLLSLIGTEFQPDFKEKILYIEDVNEPLYKIDRMLSQLRLCGVFKEIKGLLIGKFSCAEEGFHNKVKELLKEYEIPCGYGFSATHELQKTTLPLNVKYEIDFAKGYVKIIEDYLL